MSEIQAFTAMTTPTGARIVGVLETMKVYLEVNDGKKGSRNTDVHRTDGAVSFTRNYQTSKYHHCNNMQRLYMDADGETWLERDLVPVPTIPAGEAKG